jgi:hypothetical protein
VRKLIGFALLTACSTTASTTSTTSTTVATSASSAAVAPAPASTVSSSATGAASARQAVVGFLAAVKDTNLQAMGAVFGTSTGPASDRIAREELEHRELIMVCYLANDSYRIVGERPSPDGNRTFSVEMKHKALTRSTDFIATQGPDARWYMMSVELEPMQDFCAKRQSR